MCSEKKRFTITFFLDQCVCRPECMQRFPSAFQKLRQQNNLHSCSISSTIYMCPWPSGHFKQVGYTVQSWHWIVMLFSTAVFGFVYLGGHIALSGWPDLRDMSAAPFLPRMEYIYSALALCPVLPSRKSRDITRSDCIMNYEVIPVYMIQPSYCIGGNCEWFRQGNNNPNFGP